MKRQLCVMALLPLILTGCHSVVDDTNFNSIGIPFAKDTQGAVKAAVIRADQVEKSESKSIINEFDLGQHPFNAPFLKFDRDINDFSFLVGQLVSFDSNDVVKMNSSEPLFKKGERIDSDQFDLNDPSNSYSSVYQKQSGTETILPIFGLKIEKKQEAIFSIDKIAEYNVSSKLDTAAISKIKKRILEMGLSLEDYYVVMGLTVYLFKAEVYKEGRVEGSVTIPMYAISGKYYQKTDISKRLLKAQLSLTQIDRIFN